MPSYSRTVKDELARIFDDDEECLRAELAAMLKVGAILNEGRLDFSTVSAAVARKLITLLKKFYPNAKKEVSIVRKKPPARKIKYFVRIFLTGGLEKFFEETVSPEIVPDDFTKVAYLRGAFMACGTVNKPEAQYYLDISTLSESAAIFINKIFTDLEFNATFCLRKEFFVNYICEGDAIEEFLGMLGAEETLERFLVARNLKEVRANVNRMVNCETSNLNKAINAAQQQISDIKILIENKIELNEDFKLTMETRLQFPECTVGELSEKLFITRQALNYRFKKIHNLAQEILGAKD